jgi:hypothetical protein
MSRFPYLPLPVTLFTMFTLNTVVFVSAEEPVSAPEWGRFRLAPPDTAAPLSPALGTFDLPRPSPLGLRLPDPPPPDSDQAHRDSVIAAFPEYWAKVRAASGMDEELNWRGIGEPRGARLATHWMENAIGTGPDGALTLNLAGIGWSLARAWKARAAERERAERFQRTAEGLIGLAGDLERSQGKNRVAVSFIVARLGFMAKRVGEGNLPPRPERDRIASELKAWAGNPEFASTALSPRLAELCSLYVDYH